MELTDKIDWLGKHGHVVKLITEDAPDRVEYRWESHSGLKFRAEAETHEQAWEFLFFDVKETILVRINNWDHYGLWNGTR